MQISGLQKLTLLDYPNHLACTLFAPSCNFRCPWCHNAQLVLHPENEAYSENEIFDFLSQRRNILEGVCISGGEPTLQKDLPDFIKRVRSLGFLVKLDTNGSNPELLSLLIKQNLVDYVAMDIKNCKEKYAVTCGVSKLDISKQEASIALLMNSSISYEFRTTIVKEFHTPKDIQKIGEWIKGSNAYYLQSFVDSKDLIGQTFTAYSKEEMIKFQKLLADTIPNTMLRGIE